MPAARRSPLPASPTPWAIAALAGFGLIYAGFPSWDYYFDGLVFAGAVESVAAGAPPARLFHPHHLLYCPIAWAGYEALGWTGLRIRAWLFLQLSSAACGVATLWMFRRLARRLGAPPLLADAAMTALGASYIFWHFSTQGDTTIPLTLALLGVLGVLAHEAERPGGPTSRGAGRLGGLIGAAALLHEAAILIIPAALWVLARATVRRAWARLAGVLLGTAGAVMAAGYLAACRWGVGLRRPEEMLAWVRGYFGAEPLTGYAPHYGRWAAGNLLATFTSFGEAFVGPAADGASIRPLTASLLAALGAAWAARGLATARHAPARRAVLEGLAVWLATHLVFFTWWMPGHTRFWALALPGWLLLLCLGLCSRLPSPKALQRAVQGAWIGVAVLILLVGWGPFRREIRPAANRWLPIAERLAAATPPESVVLISGIGEFTSLKVYLPYFSSRYMMVLDWRFPDATVPAGTAVDRLHNDLAALCLERDVYVVSEALASGLDVPFERNHGVTPAMRRRLFASFRLHRIAELEPGLFLLKL